MATKKVEEAPVPQKSRAKFADKLMTTINKEIGKKISFNATSEDSPVNIRYWNSTGSKQLDWAISNRPNGGYPGGRIIEIFGPPSIGKSHIGSSAIGAAQKSGGLGAYFDAESAVSIDQLRSTGVNTDELVYAETNCAEEIMESIKALITAWSAENKATGEPLVIVVDSIAAMKTKAQLEADADDNFVGTIANFMSNKFFPQIVPLVATCNCTLIMLNQIRTKIGVMFGDPTCVDPYTTHSTFRFHKPETRQLVAAKKPGIDPTYDVRMTFAELAETLGIELEDVEHEVVYDMSDFGVEIQTARGFSLVTNYVVKPAVETSYFLPERNFRCSSEHRLFDIHKGDFVSAAQFEGMEAQNTRSQIVDITVPETSSYYANGLLHHNTTPGGASPEFYSSVRIRLTGKKKITDKEGVPVGIVLSAECVKNKVAPPYAKVQFEIRFGKGLYEAEYIMKELKDKSPIQVSVNGTGYTVELGGTTWKFCTITSSDGRKIFDEKAQQVEPLFAIVRENKQAQMILDAAMESAYKRTGSAYDAAQEISYSDIPDHEEALKKKIKVMDTPFEDD